MKNNLFPSWPQHLERQKQILVLERNLYHGTIIDHAQDITKHGLQPQLGDFTKDCYAGSYDFEDESEMEDYFQALCFASDNLTRAVGYSLKHIARKLKKSVSLITDQEFIRHAALVVIKAGDEYFDHRPLDDNDEYGHYSDISGTIEPGDWFSDEAQGVDYVLTSNKLARYLRQRGLFPLAKYWEAEKKLSNR